MNFDAVKTCPICRHGIPPGGISRTFAKRDCKACGAQIEFIPTLEDWSMGTWKAVLSDGTTQEGVWKF